MNDKQKDLALELAVQACRWIATNTGDVMHECTKKGRELLAAFAAALRRAANEAAWDGYRTKRDIIGAAKMTEKYGPKEARDE